MSDLVEDIEMVEEAPQKYARRTNFWVLPFVFVLGAIIGLVLPSWLGSKSPRVNFSLAGADVSHAGGKFIIIGNSNGKLRQICNGICDDIQYKFRAGGPNYAVRIQNPTGRCILCEDPYLDGPTVTIAEVSGMQRLQLNEKFTSNRYER